MKKILAAVLLSLQVSHAAIFSWDPSVGADFYMLYESTDGAGVDFRAVGMTIFTSLEYTSRAPDAQYRVTANSLAGGESEPSNIIEATVLELLGINSFGELGILWRTTTAPAVLEESTDMHTWTPASFPIDTRTTAQKFFRLHP